MKTPVLAIAMSSLALATAGACADGSSGTPEHVCSGASALTNGQPIRGDSLPSKTIALTFDDGPGPRTLELSAYLASQGIEATFFVNGKNVTDTTVLARIVADGHVIGNHTQHHKSLTGQSTSTARLSDAVALAEIADTDAIIAPFVTGDRFMFRPPYGDYDLACGSVIEGSPMAKYVAPIDWKIGDHMGWAQASDWMCWRDWKPVNDCGDLYMQEIESVGHGIVLMHDPYFIGGDPARGGTVDMVKYIVPQLVAKGFHFVRVDEVPEVAALLPAPPPPPTTDAVDASSTTNSTGSSSMSGDSGPPPPAVSSASGGKPDPCPASPQARARNSAR